MKVPAMMGAIPLLAVTMLSLPQGGEDPFALAVTDYRQGRYKAALTAFKVLLAMAGEQASPELLGNVALAALRQRRPADAEVAARRLLEFDNAADQSLAEFLLGQAVFERATMAEMAASLTDAEPGAWQSAVDAAVRAMHHWQVAAELRDRGSWPEATRNAERAWRRIQDLRQKRDAAQQESKSEPAPKPKPPAPEAVDQPEIPEIASQPLPAAEVARLLERLQQKEREKRLLRRVTNRTNRVGERDW